MGGSWAWGPREASSLGAASARTHNAAWPGLCGRPCAHGLPGLGMAQAEALGTSELLGACQPAGPSPTPEPQIRRDSVPTGEGMPAPSFLTPGLGWPMQDRGLGTTTQHRQGSQSLHQLQHMCHRLREAFWTALTLREQVDPPSPQSPGRADTCEVH